MRLGERSTRGRSGDGGQLTHRRIVWLAMGFLFLAAGARAASVGPGRIVCNASFCELGSGAHPKERIRVIISELPRDDVARLRKCTGVSKPCIVRIEGTEQGSPMRIMAAKVDWQE